MLARLRTRRKLQKSIQNHIENGIEIINERSSQKASKMDPKSIQNPPKMHQKMNMFFYVFWNTNLCKNDQKMTSFWAARGGARSQLFAPGALLDHHGAQGPLSGPGEAQAASRYQKVQKWTSKPCKIDGKSFKIWYQKASKSTGNEDTRTQTHT